MKKLGLILLFILAVGCSKQEEVKVNIDEKLTQEYIDYYNQNREEIHENDIIYYGVSGKNYSRKYTIYPNQSMIMEQYSNYRDDENGKLVSDYLYMAVNQDHTMIYLDNGKEKYYSELTDLVANKCHILNRESISKALDQAADIRVIKDQYGVPLAYFDLNYQDRVYEVCDTTYFNQEYEQTYTYTVELPDEKEGYLSIVEADAFNQKNEAVFDLDQAKYIDEQTMIELMN